MARAIFLDRDGIINQDTGYVHQISQFRFQPGIFSLCAHAQQLGMKLIVITNQSGIARGMYTEQAVNKLHHYMQHEFRQRDLWIDAIYFCPHHPHFTGQCLCRKPQSLLFEKALAQFQLTPSLCWAVGDRCRDIQAARRVGCKTILVGEDPCIEADIQVPNVQAVKAWIE